MRHLLLILLTASIASAQIVWRQAGHISTLGAFGGEPASSNPSVSEVWLGTLPDDLGKFSRARLKASMSTPDGVRDCMFSAQVFSRHGKRMVMAQIPEKFRDHDLKLVFTFTDADPAANPMAKLGPESKIVKLVLTTSNEMVPDSLYEASLGLGPEPPPPERR